MKIGEAQQIYRDQVNAYRKQRTELSKQLMNVRTKMERMPGDEEQKKAYESEAATLQLTLDALDEKESEYQEYLDQLAERYAAYWNAEVADQQKEAGKEYAEEMGKIMEVARRLMKGSIVPASDEKKLMEFSMDMYQMAKNIGAMVRQEKKEKYDTLWGEEKKKNNRIREKWPSRQMQVRERLRLWMSGIRLRRQYWQSKAVIMKGYLSTIGVRRIMGMVVGNVILGIGIAVFRISLLGNDPFSAMMMAGAERLGIAYGLLVPIVNILFFTAEITWGRHFIGIGTFVNWFLLGAIAEQFIVRFEVFGIAQRGMPVRLLTVAVGVLVVSLGVSLYQSADLGIAPYDSISIIMSEHSPLPYFWCRLATDVVCAAVCFVLGGIVNVGTAVCAFGLGPFIHFFDRHVSQRLLGICENKQIQS